MAGFDYNLLIVGSGPGGQEAAISTVRLGKRIADIKLYVGDVSLRKAF